jgi:hypothetical protein
MKRLLLCTALIAAPALLPDMDVQASPIQRCVTNGAVVYTDKACRSLGAQPAPMSPTLIRNLVAAERENAAAGVEPGFLWDENGSAEATEEQRNAKAYLAARRGTATCARTPEQLELLLRGAVSMGDVNRIATAYHWAGMGSAQAKAVLTRLEGLAQSPVTSTNYYNATIGEAALASISPGVLGGGGAGYLQLVQSGGTQVTEFEVHRLAGCYFVSF